MQGPIRSAWSAPQLPPDARKRMLDWGWLSHIDPEIAGRFLDLATVRMVPEGAVVYQAGADSGEMFGVLSGQVVMWHQHGSTDAQFVHMFRTGHWFGWAPILAGERRRHQCIARTDAELAVIPRGILRSFLSQDPEHWHALASLVDIQGQQSELAGLDLMRRSQEGRLVATLLRFAGCRLADAPDGPPWNVALTQLELAEAANMSRNAASRLLVEMEADGLVALHYRHLSLLQPDRMRALLGD
jgi:CRP-like cAMP-binding protein